MATTYTPRTFANGASFSGRFFATFANAFADIADWNDSRVTRSKLNKLTDRELDDIGLCRGDIDLM